MKDRDLTTPFEPKLAPPTGGRPACHPPIDGHAIEVIAAAFDVDVTAAQQLLTVVGGLKALASASESELVRAGLQRRKATRLRHVLELARLATGERPVRGQRLAGASDVWVHLRARLCDLPVEEFWAVALDTRHRVLFDQMLARGSLTGVEVHPRDVFRPLIRAGCAAVIFAHNHPSGDPSPSRADIELTGRLREVGDLCGIPVLDHVVVASEGYVSIAERGWR